MTADEVRRSVNIYNNLVIAVYRVGEWSLETLETLGYQGPQDLEDDRKMERLGMVYAARDGSNDRKSEVPVQPPNRLLSSMTLECRS